MASPGNSKHGLSRSGSAVGGTPEKPTVSLLHWGYMVKIPYPPKTGNKLKDDDAESRTQLLASTIETLVEDPNHLLPTHSLLEKRRQAAKTQAQADADAIFDTLTTVRSIPEDWIIGFLVKRSDLQVSDILAAKKQDGDAAWCLLQYETQVPQHVHLWQELQVKEVMMRFLMHMSEKYGNRLQHFKREGGLVGQCVVWKKGCFACNFHEQTDKLTKITHRATRVEVAIEDTYIDKTWKLDGNLSDHSACFRKGNSPPYKVTSFFPKGRGPLASGAITSRHKETHQKVLEIHQAWLDEVARTKSAASGNNEAAQGLEDMKKEARKSATESMRQKGLERVAAKRAKRMHSFE